MNNRIKNYIWFAVGCMVGSTATFLYLKKNYEHRVNSELQKLKITKQTNHTNNTNMSTEQPDPITQTVDQFISLYSSVEEHRDYGHVDEKERENMTRLLSPRVIHPDEEADDYDEGYLTVYLTYYTPDPSRGETTGVLANQYDEIITEVEERVGTDYMNHFGQFEPGIVRVRNDEYKIDYIIDKSDQTYSAATHHEYIYENDEYSDDDEYSDWDDSNGNY